MNRETSYLHVNLIRAVHKALAAGSCAQGNYPPDLWDAASAEECRTAARRRQEKAIKICEACPVRSLCKEFAEALPETSGVWGGVVYEDHTKRPYQSRVQLDRQQQRAQARISQILAKKGGALPPRSGSSNAPGVDTTGRAALPSGGGNALNYRKENN